MEYGRGVRSSGVVALGTGATKSVVIEVFRFNSTGVGVGGNIGEGRSKGRFGAMYEGWLALESNVKVLEHCLVSRAPGLRLQYVVKRGSKTVACGDRGRWNL